MISLDLIEDNFIKKNATLYNLSALIGADRFSFLVLDKNQNVVVLRSYIFEANKDIKSFIRKTYFQDEILKLDFASVKIAVNNSKHTIVPSALFDDKYKSAYLENIVDLHPSDNVEVDDLKILNAKNIYAIDKEMEEMISDSFSNMKLFHGSTAFLMGAYSLTDVNKGYQMFINVLNRKLNILLFQKKDLMFNNSFSFQSIRDFVYYIMLVLDQFKIDPETIPVYVCGQIIRESEIFKLMYRYIKEIHFLEAPDHLAFRSKYEALNAYKFFDLFSLKLCE